MRRAAWFVLVGILWLALTAVGAGLWLGGIWSLQRVGRHHAGLVWLPAAAGLAVVAALVWLGFPFWRKLARSSAVRIEGDLFRSSER